MSFELKQRHKLALWQLALAENHAVYSDQLSIEKKDRDELVSAGLITAQKHGRKIHVEITDKGFHWCNEHLQDQLSGRAAKPMIPIINSLLTRLARLFEQSAEVNAVGTFINKTKPLPKVDRVEDAPAPVTLVQEVASIPNLEQAITETCLKLNNGVTSKRIRIADVKQFLSDFSHQQIDETLLKLNDEGRLVLYPMDDPQDIKPEDELAAIHLTAGAERHIIYLESK